jgi:hypothetical protein
MHGSTLSAISERRHARRDVLPIYMRNGLDSYDYFILKLFI